MNSKEKFESTKMDIGKLSLTDFPLQPENSPSISSNLSGKIAGEWKAGIAGAMGDRKCASLPRNPGEAMLCHTCGQFHEVQGTHLYDYYQSVDEDLLCQICLQPLVNPLDTKCGHTFCMRCIKNYLKIQKICPVDRQPLSLNDCMQSSIMVRKLLDKLLVVCPNVDYCEEVLPRSDLEAHLQHRCRGAVIECVKSHLGCTFQGPRRALKSHLWECPFRDDKTVPPRVPLVEGEVNTIEIQRGCYDLGISIIGGIDTPLVCVIIQEVFQDGVAYKDGRLRSGDQVLEVNGEDLTQATHEEARQALAQLYPICTLTIYRERADESHPIEKEEVFKITLQKVPGKQLGVKLVGKKNGPGVYILSIIPGGLAAADGRLAKDDRILEINQQDVTFGTQEIAANIIQAAAEKVCMVVSRCSRPQTPDLIRSASKDCLTEAIAGEKSKKPETISPKNKDKVCAMSKLPHESLGISVAGGVGSQRGDVPIYITNIQPDGCVGKNKTLKKGDILLSINGLNLLGLTHNEAVRALKAGAEAKTVSLKYIDGPETCDGIANFTPSWSYWLQLPRQCQVVKTIALSRSSSGSLGFSVVGGNDPSLGNQPIHVKTIVPKSPADQDGRLRCGDIILSVNNYNLCDIEHTHAVSLLKHVKGTVALNIVSWPGTIV